MSRKNLETLAFLVPTLRGGGAERVVSRLSTYLSRTVPTVVITWDGRDRAYDVGCEVIDAALPAGRTIVAKLVRQHQRKLKIAELCATLGVARVVSFMESASIPLLRAKPLLNPSIHVSVAVRISPSRFGLFQRCQMQNLYPRADSIVLQTAAGRDEMVNNWGLPADKCRVIPNPLDPQFLGSLPAHSSRIPGLVVAVGRLEAQKRFGDLISAFADLPRNQASRLVIVGAGSELRGLAEYARERYVEDRVSFVGRTSDVIYWLDRCSLFVLSSGFEGFPNALAEAMARGCAVVSTDCETGPSEMVEHGVSGLLVPVGDIVALSGAMRQVLDNLEFGSQLGMAARRTAEKWSLETVAPLWL